MGKKKPEMTQEETEALIKEVEKIRTGEKLTPSLIIIIAISILGIAVYVYTAIAGIGSASLATYFPLIMYILMYLSIIGYVKDYFVEGKQATIDGMLMRYCALTGASIITAGQGIGQGLLTINVIILILVPMMRENLHNMKKDTILGMLIAVLCVVGALIKLQANMTVLSSLSGIALVAGVFDAINPTVQWLIFIALYFIRCKKGLALVEKVKAAQNK